MPPILTPSLPKETKTNSSPLGVRSHIFWVKDNAYGSILDQPALGLLEFYPAGYTKHDPQGHPRQDIYKHLFERAVELGKEQQQYPLGRHNHNVILTADPTNPHDSSAIIITLNAAGLDLPTDVNLGFVPMKISKSLAPNLSMITQGKILKVRNAVHGKYYSAKVIFSYGDTNIISADRQRFTLIMDE